MLTPCAAVVVDVEELTALEVDVAEEVDWADVVEAVELVKVDVPEEVKDGVVMDVVPVVAELPPERLNPEAKK